MKLAFVQIAARFAIVYDPETNDNLFTMSLKRFSATDVKQRAEQLGYRTPQIYRRLDLRRYTTTEAAEIIDRLPPTAWYITPAGQLLKSDNHYRD
jgi:hypothetical protein